MFRLQDKATGLWYKFMDENGDIIWTEYKDKALVFEAWRREFWEQEYGDELEIIELGEDEVMGLMGMARLPGF